MASIAVVWFMVLEAQSPPSRCPLGWLPMGTVRETLSCTLLVARGDLPAVFAVH